MKGTTTGAVLGVAVDKYLASVSLGLTPFTRALRLRRMERQKRSPTTNPTNKTAATTPSPTSIDLDNVALPNLNVSFIPELDVGKADETEVVAGTLEVTTDEGVDTVNEVDSRLGVVMVSGTEVIAREDTNSVEGSSPG